MQPTPQSLAGLYVHIPFCKRKCAYCDFASFAGLDHLASDYVRATLCEIGRRAPAWQDTRFISIYIGGGTPTLLSVSQLVEILQTSRRTLSLAADAEITLEANPGTVDAASLRELRQAGFSRLSLGVQSLCDDELRLLGRIHTAAQARAALVLARRAGFENINLDLIFGLPGQSLRRWLRTLRSALALQPEHLSLYGLTLEEGTPMARQVEAGALPRPDDDLAADMYTAAEGELERTGYQHYEISNWARRSQGDEAQSIPALASRHNLLYWRNAPYLGIGAAAHSYDGLQRSANVTDPERYIETMARGEDPVVESEWPDLAQAMGETLMLGLRLMQGVRWAPFIQRFGVDARMRYAPQIEDLVSSGLLIADENGMRLSRRGYLLGNRVFGAFLAD
jgi:oxygen-independent coproporphyrinogen-3 oxidase